MNYHHTTTCSTLHPITLERVLSLPKFAHKGIQQLGCIGITQRYLVQAWWAQNIVQELSHHKTIGWLCALLIECCIQSPQRVTLFFIFIFVGPVSFSCENQASLSKCDHDMWHNLRGKIIFVSEQRALYCSLERVFVLLKFAHNGFLKCCCISITQHYTKRVHNSIPTLGSSI